MKRLLLNIIWVILAVAIVIAAGQALGMLEASIPSFRYYSRIFVLAGVFVTLAVSLNLINGITGQFSLGHAGFYAIGAYLSCGFSMFFALPKVFGADWSSLSSSSYGIGGIVITIGAIIVGMVCAGAAGYIVGLPSLRLKGDYLAIATLGFAEIVRVIFINNATFNGARGLSGIPHLTSFVWVWLIAIACIFCTRNLFTNAHGLAFLAVREDETAASSMGLNTTNYKVIAFVIGAIFAGAAGACYAHWDGFISPDTFRMDVSFIVVTMVVLGGHGSVTGSVLAGVGLTVLLEVLRNLPSFYIGNTQISLGDMRMLWFSLILILTMVFRPQGLFGHHEFSLNRLLAKFKPTRGDASS